MGGTSGSEDCAFLKGSNFDNRQQINVSYFQTYNLGLRNHPNFSWKEQGQPNFLNAKPVPIGFPQMPNFPSSSNQLQAPEKKPALEDLLVQFMVEKRQKTDNQDIIIKKLDVKVEQLAQSQQQLAQHIQASLDNLEM